MNRELEIRERVALYGLELTGHDREALDIARGNLEFYAYSDLRYLLSETARLRANADDLNRAREDANERASAAEIEAKGLRAELDAAKRRAETAEAELKRNAVFLAVHGVSGYDLASGPDYTAYPDGRIEANPEWRGPTDTKEEEQS